MRLSSRHKEVIEIMEAAGYVWLSNLNENTIQRFRNRRRKGFKGYFKVEGLTFLTPRVVKAISRGTNDNKPRMTVKEQLAELEKDLIELEKELYLAKGESIQKLRVRLRKQKLIKGGKDNGSK